MVIPERENVCRIQRGTPGRITAQPFSQTPSEESDSNDAQHVFRTCDTPLIGQGVTNVDEPLQSADKLVSAVTQKVVDPVVQAGRQFQGRVSMFNRFAALPTEGEIE